MDLSTEPSLERILDTIPPQTLDQKISDIHLDIIATSFAKWKLVCSYLGITGPEEEAIEVENRNVDEQRRAVLQKWRQKYSPTATYRNLAKCFYNARRSDMVEAVCEALRAPSDSVAGQSANLQGAASRKRPAPSESQESAKRPRMEGQSPEGTSPAGLAVARRNRMIIGRKWSALVGLTEKVIHGKVDKSEINTTEFRLFLGNLYSSMKMDGHQFVRELFPPSADVSEMFLTLTAKNEWSFMNYYFLESVIEQYGDDETKDEMEQYKQDLNGYTLATMIKDHLNENKLEPSKIPEISREKTVSLLKVKIKEVNITEHSLNYIENLWKSLQTALPLPGYLLVLYSIGVGCLEIVWCIPSQIVAYIIQRAKEMERYFKEQQFIQVSVDDVHIYTESEADVEVKDKDELLEEAGLNSMHKLGEHVQMYKHMDDGQRLLQACISGEWDVAEALISSGCTLEVQDKDGRTPLHNCCIKGKVEIIKMLIEHGANATAEDNQGFTCLHYKETLESIDTVVYLVHNGTPVDTPSKDSCLTPLLVCCFAGGKAFEAACHLITKGARINGSPKADTKPLITASEEGHVRMVELLLANGANANLCDQDGNTALLKACACNRQEVAERLLQGRPAVNVNAANNEGLNPLMAAVTNSNLELVGILISHGADVNCSRIMKFDVGGGEMPMEMTPLTEASARGSLKIVQALVKNKAKVNCVSERAFPPIVFAVHGGHTSVVEYLLNQNNLDASLNGLSHPFVLAVKCKNRECADLLIAKYGGIDRLLDDASQNSMCELVEHVQMYKQMDDGQRLLQACICGEWGVAEVLISSGCTLEVQDKDGRTPLHNCCIKGKVEIVKLLIEHGANTTAKDKRGFTCLHYKESLASIDIVMYLVRNGTPVDMPSQENYLTPLLVCCLAGEETFEAACHLILKGARVNGPPEAHMKPLITASGGGHLRMVELLLANGANANLSDQDGNTALLKACACNRQEVAERLLQGRPAVNVNAANSEGLTPLMAAVTNSNVKLVGILISYGADVNCSRRQLLEDAAQNGMHELLEHVQQMGFPMKQQAKPTSPPSQQVIPPEAFTQQQMAQQRLLQQLPQQKPFPQQQLPQQQLPQQQQPPQSIATHSPQEEPPQEEPLNDFSDDAIHRLENELVEQKQTQSQQCQHQTVLNNFEELPPFANNRTGVQNRLPRQQAPTELKAQSLDHIYTSNMWQMLLGHIREMEFLLPPISNSGSSVRNRLPRQWTWTELKVQLPNQLYHSNLWEMLLGHIREMELLLNVLKLLAKKFKKAALNPDQDLYPESPPGLQIDRLMFLMSQLKRKTEPEETSATTSTEKKAGAFNVSVLKFLMTRRRTEPEETSSMMFASDLPKKQSASDLPRKRRLSLQSEQRAQLALKLAMEFSNSLTRHTLSSDLERHSEPMDEVSDTFSQFSSSEAVRERGSRGEVINTAALNICSHISEFLQCHRRLFHGRVISMAALTKYCHLHQLLVQKLGDDETQFDAIGQPEFVDQLMHQLSQPIVLTAKAYFKVKELKKFFDDINGLDNNIMSMVQFEEHRKAQSLKTLLEKELEKMDTKGVTILDQDLQTLQLPAILSHTSPSYSERMDETLREFAQICISAAIRHRGHERLIDMVASTGYSHLLEFFVQYFASSSDFAHAEFFNGDPSPLNFLLSGQYVTKANFESELKAIGKPEFVEQLMVVLHQFPGKEHLPWTSSGIMEALFNQDFTIGSPFPNPSSLRLPSPPPPQPLHQQSKLSLPESASYLFAVPAKTSSPKSGSKAAPFQMHGKHPMAIHPPSKPTGVNPATGSQVKPGVSSNQQSRIPVLVNSGSLVPSRSIPAENKMLATYNRGGSRKGVYSVYQSSVPHLQIEKKHASVAKMASGSEKRDVSPVLKLPITGRKGDAVGLATLPGPAVTSKATTFGPKWHSPHDEFSDLEFLEKVARHVSNWKMLGQYLGLGEDTLDAIHRENNFSVERCYKMLIAWKTNFRAEATYPVLEQGLMNIGKEDLLMLQSFEEDS